MRRTAAVAAAVSKKNGHLTYTLLLIIVSALHVAIVVSFYINNINNNIHIHTITSSSSSSTISSPTISHHNHRRYRHHHHRRIKTTSVVYLSKTNNNNNNGTATILLPQPPSPPPLFPTPQIQYHGIPVGAAILPVHQIQNFRLEIARLLPNTMTNKVEYRGVDPYPLDGSNSGWRMIHVPTEVAALLSSVGEDGVVARQCRIELMEFVEKRCGGVYLPGVRRPKGRRFFRKGGHHLEPITTTNSPIMKDPMDDAIRPQSNFTFVELFAGIGGFRLGLEAIGGTCILATERNPHACQIYRRHFQQHQNNNTPTTSSPSPPADVLLECDILDLNTPTDLPSHYDILTAGFPCQPFTIRGPQAGLTDTDANDHPRGQLYQELVRVLHETQPPFFLFENVVGLLLMEGGVARHGKGVHEYEAGGVMDVILQAFRDCGYDVEWKVVNAGGIVPQYRERVFFFGSRLDLECPGLDWSSVERRGECPPLRSILDSNYDGVDSPVHTQKCELTPRQYAKLQSLHSHQAHSSARLDVNSYTPTLISGYRQPASIATRYVMEEMDGTIRHGDPYRPRFLTVRECARVMGFPEEFGVEMEVGEVMVGEVGHFYKGLGNAVVPGVVEGIGREICRVMGEMDEVSRIGRRL